MTLETKLRKFVLEAGEKWLGMKGLEIDPEAGQGPVWTAESVEEKRSRDEEFC